MTDSPAPRRTGLRSVSTDPGPTAGAASLRLALLARVPRAVAGALLAVAVYGIFATFAHSTGLLTNQVGMLTYGTGIAGVLMVSALSWRGRGPFERLAHASLTLAARTSPARWLGACVVLGWAARIGWNLSAPPVQRSDMATYMALARGLLERHEYVTDGSYAYWAPGLPFSLVPTLAVLSQESWVPLVNNLFWFGVAVAATYWLGRLTVGDRLAKVGTLLLTLWPNLIFLSGLAAKELILVALLPLSLAAYLKASRASSRLPLWALASGAALGYGALTQPSLLLLPTAFVFYECVRRDGRSSRFANLVALFLGMLLVISPWTARNYLVLHTLVPINTAGANSLYQGNNPRATGGYVPGLMDDLHHYDELTAARIARERALEWVAAHPMRFGLLAIQKQILFLGDDSSGVYGTLKRGLDLGGPSYAVLKGLSNAYWVLILTLLGLAVLRRWRGPVFDRAEIALLVLPLLYFLAVHSVFESDGRHHVAVAVPLALLAGLAFGGTAPESNPAVNNRRG